MPYPDFKYIQQTIQLGPWDPVGVDDDRFWRVRPTITSLQNAFLAPVRYIYRLSIDERMAANRIRNAPCKKFNPAKPHKWGWLWYCGCDAMTGYHFPQNFPKKSSYRRILDCISTHEFTTYFFYTLNLFVIQIPENLKPYQKSKVHPYCNLCDIKKKFLTV